MYTDLLPFVNDELLLLFIRYNYIGENFSQPINRIETADTIKGEAIYQLLLSRNYVNGSDEIKRLSFNFMNLIFNIGLMHGKIDNEFIDINDMSKQIFDRVYLRWKDLSSLARKFYSTHIYLTIVESGKDVILRDFDNLSSLDRNQIKLHLRKAKNGKTLFSETLPFLPIGDFYVAANNTTIQIDSGDQDKLRKIYNSGFIDRKIIDVNLKLNYPVFISNVIKNAGLNVDLYKYQPSSIDNLDDLYPGETDATQMKFTRDANGVLVRDGIKLDDAKLEADLKQSGICYGTGIHDTGTNCDDVYKCLLDVRPGGDISRCAAELENEDLFDVKLEEIKNINPKIMKLILENLGVKFIKQNNILYCESFESWLSKTPIRNVVTKNRNLSRYISTIISVIRTNSVILNPIQKLGKTYGLSTFKTPEGLQGRTKIPDTLDGLLFTKNINIGSSQFVKPFYPENLRHILSGGAEQSENGSQLKKLFEILFNELDKANVPLIDSDKERILATIEKMSKLELQLPRLLEDLRVYTDLIKLIDDKEKDKTEMDDFRDIRNNKSQLNDLVNKANKKIEANITKQNLILQLLYDRVQIPLVAKLNLGF